KTPIVTLPPVFGAAVVAGAFVVADPPAVVAEEDELLPLLSPHAATASATSRAIATKRMRWRARMIVPLDMTRRRYVWSLTLSKIKGVRSEASSDGTCAKERKSRSRCVVSSASSLLSHPRNASPTIAALARRHRR